MSIDLVNSREYPILIESEFREYTRVDYNIVDSARLLPGLLVGYIIRKTYKKGTTCLASDPIDMLLAALHPITISLYYKDIMEKIEII
ncbi:hypothetical protein ACTXT7_006082 [Hymenolepis weldensis]